MISPTGKAIKRQEGFTYIMALLAVALISIASAVSYRSSRYMVLKAEEQELLFRGLAYSQAIESYYQSRSPHEYPRRIEDLLQDPRFLFKRHLRQAYPALKGRQWKTILNPQKGIIGVYYDSRRRPIKQSGFADALKHFEQAESYADWKFIFRSTQEAE